MFLQKCADHLWGLPTDSGGYFSKNKVARALKLTTHLRQVLRLQRLELCLSSPYVSLLHGERQHDLFSYAVCPTLCTMQLRLFGTKRQEVTGC